MQSYRHANPIISLLRCRRGSAITVVSLLLMTVLIIVAATVFIRKPDAPTTLTPLSADHSDSQMFYIAQTALDRSIKTLVEDPAWRDGFMSVPFDKGTYSVQIYDADKMSSSMLPPNYVRIIASGEVDGVIKSVEAIWVDAMSAFNYAYSAHDELTLGNPGAGTTPFIGRAHNNAWNDGKLVLYGGTIVYGELSSVGDIAIGSGEPEGTALVYGDVRGRYVDIYSDGEVLPYSSLSEWDEGFDLNRDGDTSDIGITVSPGVVAAAKRIRCEGRTVSDQDYHNRIGNGTRPVSVGRTGIGAIVDPRPDFVAYYELTSGATAYPPHLNHTVTSIAGDGEGHYFNSAQAFVDWLLFLNRSSVACWRCSGGGRIDPGHTSMCPDCNAAGRVPAIEIAGVFYIDDEVLDLSELGYNLLVHGTIVVAQGNPYTWPARQIEVPGETATIDHFPQRGRFVIGGNERMHFTSAYRSDEERASYAWHSRSFFSGEDAQSVPIPEATEEHIMRGYPAIIAAQAVEIRTRHNGLAYHPGDIGEEKLTIMQGIVYAEEQVVLEGRGGWSGGAVDFDERLGRRADDAIDEAVFNIDLNGDGDHADRVDMAGVTTVPVIEVAKNRYGIDINNDGILTEIKIGADYRGFFLDNGNRCPILIYQEGTVLGGRIHSGDQVLVLQDAGIAAAGVPFAFEVNFGSTTYQGLVSWREHASQ